jgi:hypothetical protein
VLLFFRVPFVSGWYLVFLGLYGFIGLIGGVQASRIWHHSRKLHWLMLAEHTLICCVGLTRAGSMGSVQRGSLASLQRRSHHALIAHGFHLCSDALCVQCCHHAECSTACRRTLCYRWQLRPSWLHCPTYSIRTYQMHLLNRWASVSMMSS